MFQQPDAKEVMNNVLATNWPLASAKFTKMLGNPQHWTLPSTENRRHTSNAFIFLYTVIFTFSGSRWKDNIYCAEWQQAFSKLYPFLPSSLISHYIAF
jgi:hypothetical protein